MASNNDTAPVTFRMPAEKRAALDELAKALERDRSYVLNEAVDAYLETHAWQLEHTKEAIEEARQQEYASPEAVSAALARMRKNLSS